MGRARMQAEMVSRTPPVAMLTAPNPGPKTLTGTHTFVVGRERAYVIDPGPELPAYQQGLANWLRADERRVRGILLSHGHPDHAPGASVLGQLLAVPIWASASMSEDQAKQLGVERRFRDGQEFAVDADVLQARSTPGHSPDHVAFWLVEARILFSADAILGRGSTLVAPPEGNMLQYLETLATIRRLGARIIAPGHGPLIYDAAAKIAEYQAHRRQREQQVLAVLGRGPATAEEIVQQVYTDVDPGLHDLAAGSVRAQLDKLLAEGRVRQTGARFHLPIAEA